MNKLIDWFTDATAAFLGSWWAVTIHIILFSIWLLLGWDINTLTLYVSLEAIFIGIFLLMAANRAEDQRERLHAKEQAKMITEIETDVNIDKIQRKQIDQVLAQLKRIEAKLNKQK